MPTASQIRSTVAEVEPSARKMSRAAKAISMRSSAVRRAVSVAGLLTTLTLQLPDNPPDALIVAVCTAHTCICSAQGPAERESRQRDAPSHLYSQHVRFCHGCRI